MVQTLIFIALCCVNFICTDKNGCGRNYVLDLPVWQYWSAVVYNAEVVVKFSVLPSIQNYPELP